MQRGSVGMDFPDLANILGKSGDPAVFEPLMVGLREGSEYIRSVCALALGYFGDKRAIPLNEEKKGFLLFYIQSTLA
jgi:HEAT repeat protein